MREGEAMLARLADRGASNRSRGGAETAQGTPIFRRQFLASDAETRATLLALMQALAQAGIGDDDASNAELILAEALNNVAEHAYAEGTGPVELVVTQRRNGLVCTIIDHGRAMPHGAVPSPALPVIEPPDDLPEGGFGWHIIRCLSADLAYRRDKDRNCLSLRVPWADVD